MTLLITAIYGLVLFLAGIFFVRQGRREQREKEIIAQRARRHQQERRSGKERRKTATALSR